jgi:hypothetical protein
MFLIEKGNTQVIGWLRASLWVPFCVILRLETGPDNHKRRLIYVKQSKGHRGGATCFSTQTQNMPKLIFTNFQYINGRLAKKLTC